MTTRKISLEQIPEMTQREAAHQILNARDRVGVKASQAATEALSAWKGTAPYRTGRMRATPILKKNKGVSGCVFPSGSGKVLRAVNTINLRGKRDKGFYDRFKRAQGRKFLTSVTR